jgi:hypothetical protein
MAADVFDSTFMLLLTDDLALAPAPPTGSTNGSEAETA